MDNYCTPRYYDERDAAVIDQEELSGRQRSCKRSSVTAYVCRVSTRVHAVRRGVTTRDTRMDLLGSVQVS